MIVPVSGEIDAQQSAVQLVAKARTEGSTAGSRQTIIDSAEYFPTLPPDAAKVEMTDETVGFGALLSTGRRSAGLSQQELAERTGLSVRAISNLERGRTRWPHPDSVSRLADALALQGQERERFVAAAGRRLRGDPAFPPPRSPAAVVPRQLPAAVPHFVGRVDEQRELSALLDRAGTDAAVVISAVGGTAGVGKTALALHWAHQVAGRFRDGQLYANLRGFDCVARPVDPAEVLYAFLVALGVVPERIPVDLDTRAALYRSLLAGRQVLVLLDNAAEPAQVRPLLPGTPGCLVLVTSRSRLTDLVALDGAHSLALDVLSIVEARELLVARLGARRVGAESAAVDELVELSARLPLALSIAASRASTSPGTPLGRLVAELRDTRRRLDLLSTGDGAANLRAVFSCSYRALSGPTARMFRLLGVHPGADIGIAAAASLAATGPDTARQALHELSVAHLLIEHLPGRYSFHDLLRAYAAELAGTDPTRRAATHRILDHYLHSARTATLLLFPARDPVDVEPARPGTLCEDIADDRHALAWFDIERPALLAATALAARAGFGGHAWQIPATFAVYLERRGHWYDYVTTQTLALAAARRAADPAAQANALCLLGRAYGRLGRHDEADTHLHEALELYRGLGDRVGQAHAQHSLGWVAGNRGRYQSALRHARQSLALYRSAGHRTGEARALNTVGWYGSLLGMHRQALWHCQQALELHHELGNHDGEADAWDSLGHAHHHLGHHADAIACYQQALDLFGKVGDCHQEAESLTRLGDVHLAAGDRVAARDRWRRAIAILEDLHRDPANLRARLRELDPPPGTGTGG